MKMGIPQSQARITDSGILVISIIIRQKLIWPMSCVRTRSSKTHKGSSSSEMLYHPLIVLYTTRDNRKNIIPLQIIRIAKPCLSKHRTHGQRLHQQAIQHELSGATREWSSCGFSGGRRRAQRFLAPSARRCLERCRACPKIQFEVA